MIFHVKEKVPDLVFLTISKIIIKSLKNALEVPCSKTGNQPGLCDSIDGILSRVCVIFFAQFRRTYYIHLAPNLTADPSFEPAWLPAQ
jgi:hypothetical protein